MFILASVAAWLTVAVQRNRRETNAGGSHTCVEFLRRGEGVDVRTTAARVAPEERFVSTACRRFHRDAVETTAMADLPTPLARFVNIFIEVWRRVRDEIARYSGSEQQPLPDFDWNLHLAVMDKHRPGAAKALAKLNGTTLTESLGIVNRIFEACVRVSDRDGYVGEGELCRREAEMREMGVLILTYLPGGDDVMPEQLRVADCTVASTPGVSDKEAAILKTMMRCGTTVTVSRLISGGLSMSEKTIRVYLKSLEDRGIVTAAVGRKGRDLTPVGKELVRSLSTEAGESFLDLQTRARLRRS
jgi:hypothetical protein